MEETLKNLLANNFDAIFAENSDAVKEIVLSSISKDAVVGVGDSATVREIGIVEELERNQSLEPIFKRVDDRQLKDHGSR
jgi:hypothetical protein